MCRPCSVLLMLAVFLAARPAGASEEFPDRGAYCLQAKGEPSTAERYLALLGWRAGTGAAAECSADAGSRWVLEPQGDGWFFLRNEKQWNGFDVFLATSLFSARHDSESRRFEWRQEDHGTCLFGLSYVRFNPQYAAGNLRRWTLTQHAHECTPFEPLADPFLGIGLAVFVGIILGVVVALMTGTVVLVMVCRRRRRRNRATMPLEIRGEAPASHEEESTNRAELQSRDQRYAAAADAVVHFDDVGPAPPSTGVVTAKPRDVVGDDDGFEV